eukprot:TRINITY_DN15023_c0_g1_i1.p1 TRINITY_DN15023_c0_g1~~TRINITY_DN15023_c0_g1_i1.p1  ORF type:complete len:184 (+),score=48.30 TRINITY_DN15023_c0_g1_i1:378-929(+)
MFSFLQEQIKGELNAELNLSSHDTQLFELGEGMCEMKEVGVNTDVVGLMGVGSNCVIEVAGKKDVKVQVRERLFAAQPQTIKKNKLSMSPDIYTKSEDLKAKLTGKLKINKFSKLNCKPYNILKNNVVKMLLGRNTPHRFEYCISSLKDQRELSANKSVAIYYKNAKYNITSKSIDKISSSIF